MKVRITVTIDSDIFANIKLTGEPISNIINQSLIDCGFQSDTYINSMISNKELELEGLKLKNAQILKKRAMVNSRIKLINNLKKKFAIEKLSKPTIVWKNWERTYIAKLKDKYGSEFNDEYGVDFYG